MKIIKKTPLNATWNKLINENWKSYWKINQIDSQGADSCK